MTSLWPLSYRGDKFVKRRSEIAPPFRRDEMPWARFVTIWRRHNLARAGNVERALQACSIAAWAPIVARCCAKLP